MKSVLHFWRQNWFVCLLWLVLILGYAWPELGNSISRHLPVNVFLTILIFFCIGLTLPSEALWHNLANWNFHLAVQLFIFIFYPLLFLLLLGLLQFGGQALVGHGLFAPPLLLGFVALSLLPSSVSSCVVFTKVSGGNETLAVVNAVLSNILGTLLSPLFISLASSVLFASLNALPGSKNGADSSAFSELFWGLSWKIFLPLLLGHLGRRLARHWVLRQLSVLSIANNLAIVLIVFFSFARAASQDSFIDALKSSPLPFLFLALVQPLMLWLANIWARLLRQRRPERIALGFTASQKTIAMGVPLLSSLFGDYADLGLVLFPLLLYHPWQLIVASFARLYYVRINE